MEARANQPINKPEIKEGTHSQFEWNSVTYAKNSTPQADRNATTLKIFGLIKGEDGLDIGCGNAKTTREIANAIYPGRMIGIDNSDSMVGKAKEDSARVVNLEILKGDAVNFKFFKRFGFITSFFCLQWVPANLLPNALENIYSHLQDNGRICMLLPCYDFPHEVIKGVAFSEKWRPSFKDFRESQTFFPEDFYNNLLKNVGFKNIAITTVESNHFLTDEEFIHYTQQWCGCYPWLKDEKLRNDFIQDIFARLAMEKHTEGKLNMLQKSMRIIANKSALDLFDPAQRYLRAKL